MYPILGNRMSIETSSMLLQDTLANLSLTSENKEEQMPIWPKCIDKDQCCLPNLTILSRISGVVNWKNPSQPHIALHGERSSAPTASWKKASGVLVPCGRSSALCTKRFQLMSYDSSQWEPSQPRRASPYAACACTSLWHLLLSFKSNFTLEGKRKPDICCWLNPDEVIEITY